MSSLGDIRPRRRRRLPRRQQFALPQRLEPLPELVHRAEEVEYTHRDTSSLALAHLVNRIIAGRRFPYPELTSQ